MHPTDNRDMRTVGRSWRVPVLTEIEILQLGDGAESIARGCSGSPGAYVVTEKPCTRFDRVAQCVHLLSLSSRAGPSRALPRPAFARETIASMNIIVSPARVLSETMASVHAIVSPGCSGGRPRQSRPRPAATGRGQTVTLRGSRVDPGRGVRIEVKLPLAN